MVIYPAVKNSNIIKPACMLADERIEIIDIITIGKRSDRDVYKIAYKRLKES